MDKPVVFKVIVYEDGTMEYSMKSLGNMMHDELLLRGWLDKIREGVLESQRHQLVT